VKEALPNIITVPSWFGFMGPAGLPAPIVARLETEIRKALEDTEVSTKLDEVGIVPVGSTGAEMAVLMRSQTDELSRLAKQVGIQPD
jgi:tripartite-type tricarboxylate transporter receptor subunit TctC